MIGMLDTGWSFKVFDRNLGFHQSVIPQLKKKNIGIPMMSVIFEDPIDLKPHILFSIQRLMF